MCVVSLSRTRCRSSAPLSFPFALFHSLLSSRCRLFLSFLLRGLLFRRPLKRKMYREWATREIRAAPGRAPPTWDFYTAEPAAAKPRSGLRRRTLPRPNTHFLLAGRAGDATFALFDPVPVGAASETAEIRADDTHISHRLFRPRRLKREWRPTTDRQRMATRISRWGEAASARRGRRRRKRADGTSEQADARCAVRGVR